MSELDIPSFSKARKDGELIDKDGYHQCENCYCKLTTRKGAYRDMTFKIDGKTVYYYHQNPIVVKKGDKYKITNQGYQTKTTKERINRYIPDRYNVIQKSFVWYVEDKETDSEKEFKNGMILSGSYDKTDKIMGDIEL